MYESIVYVKLDSMMQAIPVNPTILIRISLHIVYEVTWASFAWLYVHESKEVQPMEENE